MSESSKSRDVWNGFISIQAIFSGIFFATTHIIYGIVFAVISLILWLVGLLYEHKKENEKSFRNSVLAVGLGEFIFLVTILFFVHSNETGPQKSLINILGMKLVPPTGDSLGVQVDFKYTGEGDAKISSHTWPWFDESPNRKDFEKPNDIDINFGMINISAGEERILIIGSTNIGAQEVYKQLISRELTLYVMGTLECHNEFGKVYEREFCNRYEPGLQSFVDVINAKIILPQIIHRENDPSIYFITKIPTVGVGQPISCMYHFENTGGNAPEVVIYGKLFLCNGPRNEFTLYDNSKRTMKDFCSEKKFIADTLNPKVKVTKELLDAIRSKIVYIYCYGRFEYTDKFNKRFKTDFCDVYNDSSKTFTPVSNYKFVYEEDQTQAH